MSCRVRALSTIEEVMTADSIRRKSFPHALALTKGITTEGNLTPTPRDPRMLRCPAQTKSSGRAETPSAHRGSQLHQTAAERAAPCCRSLHFASCDVDAPRCD